MSVMKVIDQTLKILLAVVLVALCIIVFINVIGRTWFNSLTWSVELSRFLLVYLVFFSSILALKEKAHFRVDLLADNLPPIIKKTFNVLSHLLVLAFLYIFLDGSWRLVVINNTVTSDVLGIPYSYMYGIGVVTSILMAIIIIEDLYHVLTRKESTEHR